MKILRLKLKSIDYVPEMIEKIARKTGNLSKKVQEKKPQEVPQKPEPQEKQIKRPQLPQDDGQIAKYLKEIKQNIKELDGLTDPQKKS